MGRESGVGMPPVEHETGVEIIACQPHQPRVTGRRKYGVEIQKYAEVFALTTSDTLATISSYVLTISSHPLRTGEI